MNEIKKGTLVKLTSEAIQNTKMTRGIGTVVGESRKENCWRVKWDNRKSIETWAKEYLQKADPLERLLKD